MKTKILFLVTLFVVMFSMTAFANEVTWENVPGHHNQSVLLNESELASKDIVQRYARGEILSLGSSEVVNLQNGKIYVRVETYAHRSVDRIFHTFFLDSWDDDLDDWVQEDYWDFEQVKENVEGNELHFFGTEVTLSGYETNKYYRVRALHGVELNDEIEACASETNGVYITN